MDDVVVAGVLAAEVRAAAAAGKRRSWRKVTTILSAFGAYNLTDNVRTRIDRALNQAGLVVDPSFSEVSRAGTVVLTLASDEPEAQVPVGEVPAGVMQWQLDGAGPRPAQGKATAARPVLVDVNLGVATPEAVRRFLLTTVASLDETTVDDLLSEDAQAAFKTRANNAWRRASVYHVGRSEGESVDREGSQAISFTATLIEVAVGPRAVITVRHPRREYRDGRALDEVKGTYSSEDYIAGIERAWDPTGKATDGLAAAVVAHAVSSFAVTREELASYLETWRSNDARGIHSGDALLLNLQASVPRVAELLRPLQHPSVIAWLQPDQQSSARAIGEVVNRELDSLRNLSETVSADLTMVKQRHTEQYQRQLTTLAAILLAPALVASVFGANDHLSDSWLDLIVLIAVMTVVAVGGVVFIRRRFDEADARPPEPDRQ